MKRKILAVIFVLAAALMCSGAVSAADSSNDSVTTDLAVNQDTADSSAINPTTTSSSPDPTNTRTGISYTTIQAAIDDILTQDWDTIQVEDGYYPEDVYVWKLLKIVAENQYGATVNSFYINGSGSGSTIDGFMVNGGTGDAITLDGVDGGKITNNWITGGYNTGVALIDSEHIIISQNVIDDSDSANYYGIYLENSQNNDILRNQISNSIYDGIWMLNAQYTDLDSNIITGNGDNGMHMDDSDNNYLTCNTIESNGYFGLNLWDSNLNQIYGNTIEFNANGVFQIYSDSNAIHDNEINDNSYNGVYLESSNSNAIYNNEIDFNDNDGVALEYSDSNVIYGNEIDFNDNNGVFMYYSNSNEIYENAINSNLLGLNIHTSVSNDIYNNEINDNSYDGAFLVSSDSNEIYENTITNNHNVGISIWDSTDVSVNFNRIVNNTVWGLLYGGSGYVDATLNWWGYNEAPDVANQIDTSVGTVTLIYDPWIVLSISANPASVGTGGTSTIIADLLHDSNGVYHDPADGMVPYTGPANFATTLGTIADVNFSNGKATSTLTGLTKAGNALVSATVDHQTVSTTVMVHPEIPEKPEAAAGTVPMQPTGAPLLLAVFGILGILGGVLYGRLK